MQQTGVSLYKLITGEFQKYLFVNTVSMMNTISYQIENVVMDNNLPVDFYAGFQKFSFFLRQRERYEKLAGVARRVFVFGERDEDPPIIPGVEFIELQKHENLTSEWFLVVNAPYFFTALLTREITGADELTGTRRFEGLWSHNEEILNQSYLVLSQYLGQQYQPIERRDYQRQNGYIVSIANNLVARLEKSNIAKVRTQRLSEAINKVAEAVADNSDYESLLQRIVDDMQASFKARTVTIWQPDAKEPEMELIAAAGLPSNWRRALYRRQPLADSDLVAAQVIQTQEQAQVDDTTVTNKPDPFDPAVRSIVALPLKAKGKFLGALQITDHRPLAYSKEMLVSLQAIGTQIAFAMQGLQNVLPEAKVTASQSEDEMVWNILDSTLDSIIVLNPDKTVRIVNQTARHLFKLEGVKLTNQPIGALNNAELEAMLTMAEPTLGMVYSDLVMQDGKQFLLGISPAYDDTENNTLTHWTIVLREMSEAIGSKAMQTSSINDLIVRIKIGDELLNRVRSVNDLLLKIPEMGQLSAPQTRTIEEIQQLQGEVNSIANQLSLLEDTSKTAEDKKLSDELVGRLLAIEKAKDGNTERQLVKLDTIINNLMTIFVEQSTGQKINLRNEISAGIPPFKADTKQLSEAIHALIDNALKYNPRGIDVHILAHAKPDVLTIAVRDTGIGIWPKDIPFLFQRFFRVRTPQTLNVSGHGLGLPFVKAVAEGHGGRAWVSSKIGRGSTFFMEIPLIQEQ